MSNRLRAGKACRGNNASPINQIGRARQNLATRIVTFGLEDGDCKICGHYASYRSVPRNMIGSLDMLKNMATAPASYFVLGFFALSEPAATASTSADYAPSAGLTRDHQIELFEGFRDRNTFGPCHKWRKNNPG